MVFSETLLLKSEGQRLLPEMDAFRVGAEQEEQEIKELSTSQGPHI